MNKGSRLSVRGGRNLPPIPQGDASEPHEIAYGGTSGAGPSADRRQGTVDDGFGLASNAHGSQQQHEQAGYDHYASSAYSHQSQHHQAYQPSQHEVDHYNELQHNAAPSAAAQGQMHHQYGEGSQYDDYQSSAGPPGYESVSGASGQHYQQHSQQQGASGQHYQQHSQQQQGAYGGHYPHEKF